MCVCECVCVSACACVCTPRPEVIKPYSVLMLNSVLRLRSHGQLRMRAHGGYKTS